MITDQDIKKLKTVFSSKDDLKNLEYALEKHEIRTGESFAENEVRFNRIEKKLDNLENKFDDLKNQVLNVEDHIIGELQSMRTELLVATSHRRELDDHEKRITKLEDLALVN